jgi:ABC-type transporter Mla MlaB component
MSMQTHRPHLAPVVVRLPGQIDQVNLPRAYDRLYAAFVSGAAVVIADLTATTSCDAACLRQLTAVQRRAAAQDAQLRLVIPSGSPLRRLVQLATLDRLVQVYPSLGRAAAADGIAAGR